MRLFGKPEEKILIKRKIVEGNKRKGSGNRILYIQKKYSNFT